MMYQLTSLIRNVRTKKSRFFGPSKADVLTHLQYTRICGYTFCGFADDLGQRDIRNARQGWGVFEV